MAAIEFDFTRDTFDALGSFKTPEGWHIGKLESMKEDREKGQIMPVLKVTSKTAPGSIHTEYLGLPTYANSDNGAAFRTKLLKCWASRLGLISEADMGKKMALDFDKAIGKEVAFRVTNNPYEKNDGSGMKDKYEVLFDIYPLDHVALTAAIRTHLGLPLLPGQTLDDGANLKAKPPAKGRKTAEPAAAATPANTATVADFSDL